MGIDLRPYGEKISKGRIWAMIVMKHVRDFEAWRKEKGIEWA